MHSKEAESVLADISGKLLSDESGVLQADFNIDNHSLRETYPILFANGFQEVVQNDPTEPKGKSPDHVLYKGLKMLSSMTMSEVLTDHYPVVTEFELL